MVFGKMRTKHNNKKAPSAILMADVHLREDAPICRTDDYLAAQWKKIRFIKDLSYNHGCCPVFIAGDIFHKHKPSPCLLSDTIKTFGGMVPIAVAGQHDLQNHNYDLLPKSGMFTIMAAGKLLEARGDLSTNGIRVHGFPFGSKPLPCPKNNHKYNIALCHVMTYKNKKPYPGCNADNASKLLKKMKGYDLVVTGDNHEPFVVEHEGRILCNPGSMMRMSASQIDHKPRVYLWYAENNTVEPVYLPLQRDVITREHIDIKSERDERIDAFVSRLDDSVEIGFSFEENLEKYINKNKIKKGVEDLVWEAIE